MSFFSQFSEKLELKIIDIINKRKRTPIWYILFLLSRFYLFLLNIRYFSYRFNFIKKRNSIGNLIISIGNITAGGTGKTPITEIICKELIKYGRRPAILSRGYKSHHKKSKAIIVSNGKGEEIKTNAYEAGDEPLMLARNIPKAIIISHKNRVKSSIIATQRFGSDTIILDDGYQYFPLMIHINILLIDSTNPFGHNHLIPCGFLREPIKNIKRAHTIFLTKSTGKKSLRHLKKFISKHNKRAEIIECTHQEYSLNYTYSTKKTIPLDKLHGKKIAIFSGIAKPDSFQKLLEKYDCEIVYRKDFTDHHYYNQSEIKNFNKKALELGAELIITTEKDAVRFQPQEFPPNMFFCPFIFLKIEIKLIKGEESFAECIKRICWIE